VENKKANTESEKVVSRPWGSFEVIGSGEGYQVKRILIHPGESLSLQLHNYRNENWVVVQGQATVVLGDREITLKHNESIYIPHKTRHRLANHGETLLIVIEIQTGDYLGEDDIIRFSDKYGRARMKDSLLTFAKEQRLVPGV